MRHLEIKQNLLGKRQLNLTNHIYKLCINDDFINSLIFISKLKLLDSLNFRRIIIALIINTIFLNW